MKTDRQLVQQVLNGDEAAFEELVERYMTLAGGVAYQILGDFHSASEVVWEAFFKAHRFLSSLNDGEKFRPWLLEIVRKTALERQRRKKTSFVGEEFLLEEQCESGRPEEEILQQELVELVRQALATLPQEYQELLILKHMEGLSYREIGQRLSMTESAVESKLFRARKLLRERWNKMECARQRKWIQWLDETVSG